MEDGEVMELTESDFAGAVTLSGLPNSLRQKLITRDSIQESRMEYVNVNLSNEVLQKFRATGDGWQKLMNNALKDWLNTHSL
jgi:uncharacterized protein (DUF4415 family)